MLGEFEFLRPDWRAFTDWLQSPAFPFSALLRFVIVTTAALVASVVLTGFVTSLLPWSAVAVWIAPFLLFHSIVGLVFRGRVNRMLEVHSSVSVEP